MADNVNVTPAGSTPIATDDIGGVQFQKVKITTGGDGLDDGLVSGNNPLPVALSVFFKRMVQVFTRFKFSSASDLYVNVTAIPSVTLGSGTVTTVGTMTTGNVGIGDIGKPATAQLMSQMNFQSGISRNFVRS